MGTDDSAACSRKGPISSEESRRETSRSFGVLAALAAAVALAAILLALLPPVAADAASTLPSGFTESTVISGLTHPTTVKFSSDGRVFVAEKSGLIKVFDSLSDTTPTIFADLRTNVYDYWDRGLLGMALDPNFPTNPYVYVLYTYDAPIGGTAPKWGDACPTPPGPTTDGCVASGHLSRLQASGNTMTGSEKVLIEGWCQQFPSHSVGQLAFGADGALYVSAGEGANFNQADYGQTGNPCGDPPSPAGTNLTPPTAEGGSLRSQDVRTCCSDPTGLSGAILRVDPATGAALPSNPMNYSVDPNKRKIVGYGFRNPFRFTVKPGTNEIWIADVGWGLWEEIDRISNPTAPTNSSGLVQDFGWPCYEGANRQSSFDSLNLNMCENFYTAGGHATPYYAYNHNATVVAGETCPTGGSAIDGPAFYNGGSYPASYAGALFFGDYTRKCIWAMKKGTNGLPDPANIETFVASAANPVDLQIGPGGDLFYVDYLGGAIKRIQYSASTNQSPTAKATANPTNGPIPLTVNFDGTGSTDPDSGDTLTYAWDLDGDGAYDDSTASKPTYTYNTAGTYNVGLKVTDSQGASDTLDQPLVITAGNTAPTATITTPSATTKWSVGDNISFSGSASDPEDGTLPASALSWSVILHHCDTSNPPNCHEHTVQDFTGVASGSFTAPDHEYPSYLELRLTATDSGGLKNTKSVRLDPNTVTLSFQSTPGGLKLSVGTSVLPTPFSRTVIVRSNVALNAPSPQKLNNRCYKFSSWSDGGAQTHNITAPSAATTYTATYSSTRASDCKGL